MLDPSGLTVRHLSYRAWAKALPGATPKNHVDGVGLFVKFPARLADLVQQA